MNIDTACFVDTYGGIRCVYFTSGFRILFMIEWFAHPDPSRIGVPCSELALHRTQGHGHFDLLNLGRLKERHQA